jgi:hypothetical protein
MRGLSWLMTFAVAMPAVVAAASDPVESVALDARKLPGKWARSKHGDGYETPQGGGYGFAMLLGKRLPLPPGVPTTLFLRMQRGGGDESAFFGRARQVQRAAITQIRELSQ